MNLIWPMDSSCVLRSRVCVWWVRQRVSHIAGVMMMTEKDGGFLCVREAAGRSRILMIGAGFRGGTHLRCWVLRGLVLRESLVLEHVHQRRLTGVVETLGEWEREAGRRASGAAILI